MGDGLVYTNNGYTHRSRADARARENSYGPAVCREVDAAVGKALAQLHGDAHYRRAWCFYCLRLGINTFLDQMYSVLSCHQEGELREPAKAFHARFRKIKNTLDKTAGRREMKIVKTYWRDNANPFPGRLVEVRRVRLSAAERAWRDFVRRCLAARDEREMKLREIEAGQFEELVDQACEEAS